MQGLGYLTALDQDNVELVPYAIERITKNGLLSADGTTRKVDTIICATGFDTTWTQRFPVIGRHGQFLSEKWTDYPQSYLGLATDGFPNFFMSHGPNTGVGTGSLIILLEQTAKYVASAIEKMQMEAISAMSPKQSAVEGFVAFCDAYFPQTVFSLPCRSWYKSGKAEGRVTALWPGSSLHAYETLSRHRWEDWEYEYVDDNASAWLGNGWTTAGKDIRSDRSYYLV